MTPRSIGALAMLPALLLTAAACSGTAGPAPTTSGSAAAPAASATSSAAPEPAYRAGDEIARVEVQGAPTYLGTGFGSLWIAVAQDNAGALARVDPRTNQILVTIPVGGFPVGIAAGYGSIWQANYQDNTLSRIDPATNRVIATIPVGAGPAQVAIAGGLVWVADQDATLTAVDPATNRRARTAQVGRGSKFRALIAGAGSLWTPDSDRGISRLDPATGSVQATIRIRACCDGDLLFDDGVLWFGSHTSPLVYRVDTGTNRVIGHFRLGPTPAGLTMAGGRLWVAHGEAGVVSWHAVDSGRELGRHKFASFVGSSVVTDPTSIWVQTLDLGAVVRLAVGSR